MPRSPRWVVALLGAHKAGAVMVPLDEQTKEPAGDISAWIVDTLAEGETRELPVVQMLADSLAHEKSRGLQNEATPASEALVCLEGGAKRVFTHEALIAAFKARRRCSHSPRPTASCNSPRRAASRRLRKPSPRCLPARPS